MTGAAGVEAAAEMRRGLISFLDALSALRSLAGIDLRQLSSRQLASQALSSLVQNEDLQNCSVFLRHGDELRCVAGTGFGEELALFSGGEKPETTRADSMVFSSGEGLMGLACQTGQLQYCRDASRDQRFKPFADRPPDEIPGSILCVPIQFDDTVLGVLNVSHPLPEFFGPAQQYMLTLFAASLGQMLHIQHLSGDLDQAVQRRTRELQEALHEAQDLMRRYQELSTLDELTGLHNRRYFFSEAMAVLARAVRYDLPFSLLLIDADHFKRINDTWGHAVGDTVLCRIAEILREEVRSGDIVARLGGEEFVLVLPNTGPTGMDQMAMRIQKKISTIDMGGDIGHLGITVSIGMTSLKRRVTEDASALLERLYAQADQAMYQCKRLGRNRRMTYSAGMED